MKRQFKVWFFPGKINISSVLIKLLEVVHHYYHYPKLIASRITPAVSLLNSSVGINRSLDGDDAYVISMIIR
jgi:hypothetical protein